MAYSNLRAFAVGAGAVGCLLAASPGFAEPTSSESQDVSVDGIDLDTEEGRKELERRVNRAARAVCGVGQAQTGTRGRSIEERRCLARARREAEQQLTKMIEDKQRDG